MMRFRALIQLFNKTTQCIQVQNVDTATPKASKYLSSFPRNKSPQKNRTEQTNEKTNLKRIMYTKKDPVIN